MQITPDQGAFLALIVKLLCVKRAVEVGVFTGYSSLAMALVRKPCRFSYHASLSVREWGNRLSRLDDSGMSPT